jgi:hypothetical protein
MRLKTFLAIFFAFEAIVTVIRVTLLYFEVQSTTPSPASIGYFITQSINILLDFTHIEWIIYYGVGGIFAFIVYYVLENYSENGR